MTKKVILFSLCMLASLGFANTPQYVPITTEEVDALTNGEALSTLLPPGYREPLLDGLITEGGVKTLWGSKPEFDTIVSTAAYKDPLPELKQATSLELKKASLSTVFASLARDMKISYITSEDVPTDEITASFNNMTATEIFRALAAQQGLEVVEYFGAFALRTKQTPPLILRKYKLDFNYIDSGDTMEAVGAQLENNSSMSSGSGSGQNLGSGMGTISKSLKADYSEFIENIKSLAKLELTDAKSATDIKQAAGKNNKDKSSNSSSSGDTTVIYDPDNRTLLAQATWAGHEAIMTYLETINSPQENVAIEIFVAETSLSPETDLGIQWSFASKDGFTVAYNPARSISDTENLFNASHFTMDNIGATIKALQSDEQGRTYSHPRVLTTNNRSVTLESVQEVPYQSSSSSINDTSGGITNSDSTDFKRVGMTISVVPIIQGNDILRLKVSVTNSNIVGYSDSDGTPITSVRSYGGSFSLNSGEYIIIGGLGENRYTNTQAGVPLLQSIPYLGNLFGTSAISNKTSNLLIFIRPVIKKQFRKGLDITTMDKGALFANSNKWPMLFNPNDVIFGGDPKYAKDPFARSDANNIMHTFNADDIKKAKDNGVMGLRIIDGTSGEDIITEKTLPLPPESQPQINGVNATPNVDTPLNDIPTPDVPKASENTPVGLNSSYDTLLQKSLELQRKLNKLKLDVDMSTTPVVPPTITELPPVTPLTPIPIDPVNTNIDTKGNIDGNSHNVTITVSSGSPIKTTVDANDKPIVNGSGKASDTTTAPAIQPIILKK